MSLRDQVADVVRAMVRPLARRVENMVRRGVLGQGADTRGRHTTALTGTDADDDVEVFGTYGLASRPLSGAEAIALEVGGCPDHVVVVAVHDRRYRLQGLEGGEVALYDDRGQALVLRRDRIEITTPDSVRVGTTQGATTEPVMLHATASAELQVLRTMLEPLVEMMNAAAPPDGGDLALAAALTAAGLAPEHSFGGVAAANLQAEAEAP